MISEPGKITGRITLLGAPESCFYHLDGGGESVLIGGGMAYLAPRLLPQIEAFGIDVKKITKLVVLHTHFDHCGLVPYLKKLWPWMKVFASAKGASRLSDPRVTENIAAFNQMAIARAGLVEEATRLGFEFTGIEVEQTLKEGDRLVCGDVTVDFLEVPGHSSCSIAAYVPEEKALFASDAAGVYYKDFVFAAGNSNYDLYQRSLQRMAAYAVEVVLLEHYGAAVGEEARTLFSKAIEAAADTRAAVEKTYRLTGDVSQTTEAITGFVLARSPDYFLDKEILAMVIGQMVKFIVTAQEGKEKPSSRKHERQKARKNRKENTMFFELRQYRIKKGKMKQWVKYMEEVLLPFQISQGMVVVGNFVGKEEKDLYVWIRRFESEQERKKLYKKVYESETWLKQIKPEVDKMLIRPKMVVTDLEATPKSIIH